jgi:hypothetical protein
MRHEPSAPLRRGATEPLVVVLPSDHHLASQQTVAARQGGRIVSSHVGHGAGNLAMALSLIASIASTRSVVLLRATKYFLAWSVTSPPLTDASDQLSNHASGTPRSGASVTATGPSKPELRPGRVQKRRAITALAATDVLTASPSAENGSLAGGWRAESTGRLTWGSIANALENRRPRCAVDGRVQSVTCEVTTIPAAALTLMNLIRADPREKLPVVAELHGQSYRYWLRIMMIRKGTSA